MGMRRSIILLASAALAVLLVCGVALIGLEKSAQASFPGKNGKIAFAGLRNSEIDSNNWEIYGVNPDGSGQTNLTDNPARDFSPEWSPDGSKVVFSRIINGNDEVYVMNADGSDQTNLTNTTTSRGSNYHPSWSPDGSKIVFVSTRDHEGNIYVMNADGTNPVKLTALPRNGQDPTWSPDRTKIAYHTFSGGIGAINADGSGFGHVVQNSEMLSTTPDWQSVCTSHGTPANDTLSGTSGKDLICGLGGNDTIKGLGGDDVLLGGDDNDTLFGGPGNDRGFGGFGTDTTSYQSSTTAVSASLVAESATGEGSDVFMTVENLTGSPLSDQLTGSSKVNRLLGGGGNDTLSGRGANDTVRGQAGADQHFGEVGNDTLDSRDGVTNNDSLNGGPDTDTCLKDAKEKSVVYCEQ
jgi:Ca2+-binding RTX toxin-like protein